MKNYILKTLLLLTATFSIYSSVVGQDFDPKKLETSLETATFKEKFELGNRLMSENLFVFAAKVWKSIIDKGNGNGNVNFKAGYCYLQIDNERTKALPFLQEAETNISKRYDPFSFQEKNAPIETYYYLGEAYHINEKLDEALSAYTTYQTTAHKKHLLQPKAELGIAQVGVARKMLNDPKQFIISNVGNKVNSTYDEYSPVITLDESAMFFTSRRLRKDSSNKGYYSYQDGKLHEDVYVSYKDFKSGEWMEPEILNKISRQSQVETNEATISVSGDGQLLFIYRGDQNNGDIFISERQDDDNYGVPKSMAKGETHDDINSDSWETHATISADGRTLYFVSDRPGGLGGRDIYRSVKLPNGEWSKALNIGAPVNTPYDEDAPFFHPDGKTLYFSSNGKNSMGGFDVFFSQNIEGDKWTKPFNFGYPLNSVASDIFFTTTADGQRGYFSSSRDGGVGEKDIYTIDLKSQPEAEVAILKGYILPDADGKIPDGIVIWVTDKTEQTDPVEYKPNKRNGAYVFNLKPCHEYYVEYTRDEETFYETDMKVPCGAGYQEINKVISLDGVPLDENSGETQVVQNNENTNQTGNDTDNSNNNTNNTENTATIKVNKVQFQKFYGYNQKGIAKEEQRFKDFVAGVNEIIKLRGYADVEVEGSASTVPTRTFRSNTILSKKRSEDAKAILLKVLKENGVDLAKVKLKSVNSVVQGPKYSGDYKKTEKYAKYQYILMKAF